MLDVAGNLTWHPHSKLQIQRKLKFLFIFPNFYILFHFHESEINYNFYYCGKTNMINYKCIWSGLYGRYCNVIIESTLGQHSLMEVGNRLRDNKLLDFIFYINFVKQILSNPVLINKSLLTHSSADSLVLLKINSFLNLRL